MPLEELRNIRWSRSTTISLRWWCHVRRLRKNRVVHRHFTEKNNSVICEQKRISISNSARDFEHEWHPAQWSTGLQNCLCWPRSMLTEVNVFVHCCCCKQMQGMTHTRTMLVRCVTVTRLIIDSKLCWWEQYRRQCGRMYDEFCYLEVIFRVDEVRTQLR